MAVLVDATEAPYVASHDPFEPQNFGEASYNARMALTSTVAAVVEDPLFLGIATSTWMTVLLATGIVFAVILLMWLCCWICCTGSSEKSKTRPEAATQTATATAPTAARSTSPDVVEERREMIVQMPDGRHATRTTTKTTSRSSNRRRSKKTVSKRIVITPVPESEAPRQLYDVPLNDEYRHNGYGPYGPPTRTPRAYTPSAPPSYRC